MLTVFNHKSKTILLGQWRVAKAVGIYLERNQVSTVSYLPKYYLGAYLGMYTKDLSQCLLSGKRHEDLRFLILQSFF